MAKKPEQSDVEKGDGHGAKGRPPPDPTTPPPSYDVYAFQRETNRAIQTLSPYEYSVYMRCWDAYWVGRAEPLPSDPDQLAAILRMDREDVRRGLTSRVLDLLGEFDGGLYVPELKFQWDKSTHARWLQSEGGKKGAASRWGKGQQPEPGGPSPSSKSIGHPMGHPMGQPIGVAIGVAIGGANGVGRGEEGRGEEEASKGRKLTSLLKPSEVPANPARRPEEQTNEEWLDEFARNEADESPVTARMNGHGLGRLPVPSGNPYAQAKDDW
jgi:hypothetical protein